MNLKFCLSDEIVLPGDLICFWIFSLSKEEIVNYEISKFQGIGRPSIAANLSLALLVCQLA